MKEIKTSPEYLNNILLIILGVIIVFTLSGCGKPKYKLNYDGYGFESKKTEYAAGDKVTVRYDFIATDTDYHFWIDEDVEMKEDYDGGYVFTFTMPAHDVTIHEESHNSMEYIPGPGIMSDSEVADELVEEEWVFEYHNAVTGTDGYDSYDKFVLYSRPRAYDGSYILAKYSKFAEEDEQRHLCIVPYDVFDDCMAAVDEYDMRNWKDGVAPTGEYIAVRWLENGDMISITSDDMPEDGYAAFGKIESVLSNAWSEYFIP